MSDIYVTLSGNVTKDPEQFRFADGSRVTTMRMAVNRRFLDPQSNTWQNRDTTFYTIRCFRRLGDNVQQSIRKGQPVVVYGRLRVKQYERNGEQRYWVEVEAISVGHDLKYGITAFERPFRSYAHPVPVEEDRQEMEEAVSRWELTSAEAPGPPGEDPPGAWESGTPHGPVAGAGARVRTAGDGTPPPEDEIEGDDGPDGHTGDDGVGDDGTGSGEVRPLAA